MNDNFIDEKPSGEQKFTIGEKEYTQDQLNDLVTRGEFAKDVETRFNTKLDRVVPDYTRASQEAADLRRELDSIKQQQIDARASQGQLSQQELIQKAKQEAQGIGLMTDENTPQMVRTEIERYRLEDAVNKEVDDLADMGISANPTVIKRYMASMDGDSVDLNDAISDLYGNQIKVYQEAQLNAVKPNGMYTESGSNAGGFRLPDNVKVNDDNLMDLFKEAIGGNN